MHDLVVFHAACADLHGVVCIPVEVVVVTLRDVRRDFLLHDELDRALAGGEEGAEEEEGESLPSSAAWQDTTV